MPVSPDTQARLFKEADARFAAQTHITRKLDPHNPLDAKWIPVWTDIYNKVNREYAGGVIAWTYDNPFTQTSLEAASILADKSAGHFADATAAASAGDHDSAASHLAAAQDSNAAAKDALRAVAALQPVTVAPELVFHAATAIGELVKGGAAQTPHDAVAAIQATQAPAAALGVHTPGDPNPLHFTMQGGAQPYPGGGGGDGGGGAPAQKKSLGLALGIAAGAVGLGILLAASTHGGGKRRSSSSGSRTLVIRRDRVYGGR
jgi:hypothetical protein